MTTKICTKCKRELDTTEFYRDASRPDRLSYVCRSCQAAMHKRYTRRKVHTAYDSLRHRRRAVEQPFADQVIRQNNRAGHLGCQGTLALEEVQRLFRALRNVCAKCGSSDNIQIDHIKPLSMGGTNTLDNIQPLCAWCNNSKGDKEANYIGTSGIS